MVLKRLNVGSYTIHIQIRNSLFLSFQIFFVEHLACTGCDFVFLGFRRILSIFIKTHLLRTPVDEEKSTGVRPGKALTVTYSDYFHIYNPREYPGKLGMCYQIHC